eukprot:728164-Pelagomonas_calceolata.AAC.5
MQPCSRLGFTVPQYHPPCDAIGNAVGTPRGTGQGTIIWLCFKVFASNEQGKCICSKPRRFCMEAMLQVSLPISTCRGAVFQVSALTSKW